MRSKAVDDLRGNRRHAVEGERGRRNDEVGLRVREKRGEQQDAREGGPHFVALPVATGLDGSAHHSLHDPG